MSEIVLVKGSVEYLYADVSADVLLDTQPVAMAVGETLATAQWVTAAWTGDAGTDRSCRILLDGLLPVGKHGVWVKVTDVTEVPIVKAGVLRVREN